MLEARLSLESGDCGKEGVGRWTSSANRRIHQAPMSRNENLTYLAVVSATPPAP